MKTLPHSLIMSKVSYKTSWTVALTHPPCFLSWPTLRKLQPWRHSITPYDSPWQYFLKVVNKSSYLGSTVTGNLSLALGKLPLLTDLRSRLEIIQTYRQDKDANWLLLRSQLLTLWQRDMDNSLAVKWKKPAPLFMPYPWHFLSSCLEPGV